MYKEQQGNEKSRASLKGWIDEHVQIAGETYATVDEKIDLLERMLEFIRILDKRTENELPFGKALNWRFFRDDDEICAYRPGGKRALKHWGKGTSQDKLQVRLLVYLLKTMGQKKRVNTLIKGFIDEQWANLDPMDFEKMQSGVYRCHTNTGFAAKHLRDYGLLRYTHKEAFKTWRLSLSGILVAAAAIEDDADLTGAFPRYNGLPINSFIHRCAGKFDDQETMLKSLHRICAPNAAVFKTFQPVLEVAGQLLPDYWATINDPSIKIRNRQEAARQFIEDLESVTDYEEFINELVDLIDVEQCLDALPQ